MLGLAAGFIGFVGYALWSAQPVEVVSSRLERGAGGVFVAGKLRNNSDQARAVDVEVHYYDASGRPLGADTIAVKRLAAGATADFNSPPHRIDGVKDFSLYLNNGRNPYGN